MRAFLKAWFPLLAAVLVVLSIVYTGTILSTQTGRVQARLTALEQHMVALRDAMEGERGLFARLTTLESHMNDEFNGLMVQRNNEAGRYAQDALNVQKAFQAFQGDVDATSNIAQHLEYLEHMMLDIQESLEDIKKQQYKENP